MTDGTMSSITVSDRNKAAFLAAYGFEVFFEPKSDGLLDFAFIITPELFEASEAYNRNSPIPVLSYVSAQRYLTDAIRDHRQRIAVRG